MPARQTYESYTVKKGDTLSAIARRFGTTVAAIAATSGLADPNKIKVGQVLSIYVAPAYSPDDLALSDMQVQPAPGAGAGAGGPSSGGDPVVALVNGFAEWLKPPKLWITLGLGIGAAYYLFSEPGGRRRRV